MNLPLLAGLAFALFGIYLLFHSIANYRHAKASQGWPSVVGRLVEVQLWKKRLIEGEMKDAEHVKVAFSYQVNGRDYTGRLPTFYTLVYPETVEFAERYPVGSEVQVYYNPVNPADAVLVPGLKKDKPYSELILAVICLGVGIAVAVLGWLGVIG
ncbi:DUF3592 domain-containing protein [Saccharospirillum alexandrii]|uniref:DUF3592 domain-containing protein n=1 Tax=Saccharospirillum alexandrii TaxID=2448477 RepID=UPI000FDB3EB1|nr:DUF3592 domain-containing protein [Saccharospirillum alexandrii]